MAEMANGLLHQHKELDLIPRNHIKNLMSDMPTVLIAERQKRGTSYRPVSLLELISSRFNESQPKIKLKNS